MYYLPEEIVDIIVDFHIMKNIVSQSTVRI